MNEPKKKKATTKNENGKQKNKKLKSNTNTTPIPYTNEIIATTNSNNTHNNIQLTIEETENEDLNDNHQNQNQDDSQSGGARKVLTLGVKSKRILLNYYNEAFGTNFQRITQVIRAENLVNDIDNNGMYETIQILYNNSIDEARKKERIENTEVYFKADVRVERTFLKDNYENKVLINSAGDIINYTDIAFGYKKRRDIEEALRFKFDDENSLYIDKLLDFTITTFNKRDYDKRKNPDKILMNDAVVLKYDWLKYSKHIAHTAYENSDNECVYHQLTHFLLNSPTGRNNAFIQKEKTSKMALFRFFQHIIHKHELEGYDDFNIKSGVSSELIRYLCVELKRNMYAFDENTKIFDMYIQPNNNQNYCPIIYYRINTHLYLISDASIFRSVVHSVKESKNMDTSIIRHKHDKKGGEELKKMSVFTTDEWSVENAKQCETGMYLYRGADLTQTHFIEYVKKYSEVPRYKSQDKHINQFEYHNSKNERVIVAIDANYRDRINHQAIKHIAEANGIPYINEGFGNLILKTQTYFV